MTDKMLHLYKLKNDNILRGWSHQTT